MQKLIARKIINMFQVRDFFFLCDPQTRFSQNLLKKGNMKTCSEVLLHSMDIPTFFNTVLEQFYMHIY